MSECICGSQKSSLDVAIIAIKSLTNDRLELCPISWLYPHRLKSLGKSTLSPQSAPQMAITFNLETFDLPCLNSTEGCDILMKFLFFYFFTNQRINLIWVVISICDQSLTFRKFERWSYKLIHSISSRGFVGFSCLCERLWPSAGKILSMALRRRETPHHGAVQSGRHLQVNATTGNPKEWQAALLGPQIFMAPLKAFAKLHIRLRLLCYNDPRR